MSALTLESHIPAESIMEYIKELKAIQAMHTDSNNMAAAWATKDAIYGLNMVLEEHGIITRQRASRAS